MIALVALQFSMLASYVSKAVPGQALVSHGWLHIVRIATRRHLILYCDCSIIKSVRQRERLRATNCERHRNDTVHFVLRACIDSSYDCDLSC